MYVEAGGVGVGLLFEGGCADGGEAWGGGWIRTAFVEGVRLRVGCSVVLRA